MSWKDWLSDRLLDAADLVPRFRSKLVLGAIILAGGVQGGHDTVTPIQRTPGPEDQGANYSDTVTVKLVCRAQVSDDWSWPLDTAAEERKATAALPLPYNTLVEDQGSNYSDVFTARLRGRAQITDDQGSNWSEIVGGLLGEEQHFIDTGTALVRKLAVLSDDQGQNFSDAIPRAWVRRKMFVDTVVHELRELTPVTPLPYSNLTEDQGSNYSDSLTAQVRERASFSTDAANWSDSATLLNRHLANPLTDGTGNFSDSLAAQSRDLASFSTDYGPSLTDIGDKSIVDAGGGATPINVGPSDEMGVNESITLWDELAVTVQAALTPIEKPFSDDVGSSLSDTLEVVRRELVGVNDDVGSNLTDTIPRSWVRRKMFVDTVTYELRDATGGYTPIPVSGVVDDVGAGLSDTLTALKRLHAQPSDAEAITDDIAGIIGEYDLEIEEDQGSNLSDSATANLRELVVVSEDYGWPDDLVQKTLAEVGGATPLPYDNLTESLSLTDDLTILKRCLVPLSDAQEITDTLAALERDRAVLSDSQSLTDTFQAIGRQLLPFTEALSWQDSANAFGPGRVQIDDALGLADGLGGLQRDFAIIGDELSITDDVKRALIEVGVSVAKTGLPIIVGLPPRPPGGFTVGF